MSSRDDAFRDFFESEQGNLQRFATFMAGDADSAYDLVQEAFVRTYRAWRKAHIDDPGVFARRVIVNQLRDQYRRRRVRLLRPSPEEVRHQPSLATGVVDHLLIVDALNRLTPIRRAVVVLRFYEDMTEPQIADALERPLGTVKSDLHRALNALRPFLEETDTATVGGDS